MNDLRLPGPDPETIRDYILATWPETYLAEASGAFFFSLNERNFPNYATIVTTDDFEPDSNLSRPGVFRLNIGVDRATFDRLVGGGPNPDYTALDKIIPNPVYAKQHWISILNPSDATFEDVVKPLLTLAHDRLATVRARHAPRPTT